MADVSVTLAENGGSVSLRIGDHLVVRLPETPTTGFRWAVAIGPQSALAASGDDFTLGGGSAVGGGGTHSFRFVAQRQGTDSIHLKLWRDWEGEQSVTDRFRVTVTVR